MKEAMTTVGARLPHERVKRLDQVAGKRGVSRSECVRQFIDEGLDDTKWKLVEEKVLEIEQLVRLLDRRLKIALVAILVDAGKASPEEAEAFVRERFS